MEIDSDDPTVLTGRFKVNTRAPTRSISGRPATSSIPARSSTTSSPSPTVPHRAVHPARPAAIKVRRQRQGRPGDDRHRRPRRQGCHAPRHAGQREPRLQEHARGPGAQPEFRAVETLDLAKLNVKPGSSLHYWLTVRDNKEPSSNRIETARQLIEIGEPVPAAGEEEVRRQPEDPATARTHADRPRAAARAAADRARQR